MANPSNCNGCRYRYRCPSNCSNKIITGDVSGNVHSARLLPFGNFELILDLRIRLLKPKRDYGLRKIELDQLVGKRIVITGCKPIFESKPLVDAKPIFYQISSYSTIKVFA